MKTKMYLMATLLCCSFLGLMTSCGDDDDDKDPISTEVKTFTINSGNYKKWAYFSFEKCDTVAVTDATSDYTGNWDLAFHRYDIKTNNGSALMTSGTDLKAAISIPETGFVADETTNKLNLAGMPPVYSTGKINPELCKFMNLDTSVMPPNYNFYGKNVFIIKTASGRYAKLRITDYTDVKGNKPYITIEYIYPVK